MHVKKKPAKISLLREGILERRKLTQSLTFNFKSILKISSFATKMLKIHEKPSFLNLRILALFFVIRSELV